MTTRQSLPRAVKTKATIISDNILMTADKKAKKRKIRDWHARVPVLGTWELISMKKVYGRNREALMEVIVREDGKLFRFTTRIVKQIDIYGNDIKSDTDSDSSDSE